MEYTVLTPMFLDELIHVATAALLSKFDVALTDFFSEDRIRPAELFHDIEKLLSLSRDEKERAIVVNHVKTLELLLDLKDKDIVSPNDIEDAIIQNGIAYDIKPVLENVVQKLVDDELGKFLDDVVEKLKTRLNYLESRPVLAKLKDLLDQKVTIQLDEFMLEVTQLAKAISEKKLVETTCVTFDSANINNVKDLIEEYKQILDPSQYISTGYKALDTMLYGGFAKTRIYVIAGPSGCGKSTYLLNWLVRAIQRHENKLFVYITLENIVPETLLRIASIHAKKNVLEEAIHNPDVLEQRLHEAQMVLSANMNRTVIKYYSPTTPVDVICDDIRMLAKNSGMELGAVYYDYLNVMGLFSEDMRKYLGQIVRKLKDLAVDLHVPVITAAQLNRDAYKVTNPNEVGLHNVAESMLIVENADVLMLTVNDNAVSGKAWLQIRKRRYAREGSLMVRYQPECYYVQSITECVERWDDFGSSSNSSSSSNDNEQLTLSV